jgi:hypothetical protein
MLGGSGSKCARQLEGVWLENKRACGLTSGGAVEYHTEDFGPKWERN